MRIGKLVAGFLLTFAFSSYAQTILSRDPNAQPVLLALNEEMDCINNDFNCRKTSLEPNESFRVLKKSKREVVTENKLVKGIDSEIVTRQYLFNSKRELYRYTKTNKVAIDGMQYSYRYGFLFYEESHGFNFEHTVYFVFVPESLTTGTRYELSGGVIKDTLIYTEKRASKSNRKCYHLPVAELSASQ